MIEKMKLEPHGIEPGDAANQLKKLLPEAVRDGKIDFDLLRELLGDELLDEDEKAEPWGLNWPGKRDARKMAMTPSRLTLKPLPGEGTNEDNAQHVLIEGDNLEVLKVLRKSYFGQVKMIYIDPPYNTGNDFVYKDDFSEKRQEYIDNAGLRLHSNRRDSGRFHANWLSFMYPRLRLAKQLLRDDGVIFISIDDNEVANLRKLCDEIFGEESFVAVFPWRKRTAKSDVPFSVSQDFEWIVCFAKANFLAGKEITRRYYKSDDFADRWRTSDLTKQTTKAERPNSFFSLINPTDGKEYPANPNRVWSITGDTFEQYYSSGKIIFPGAYDFLKIKGPCFRVFESEDKAKSLKKFGTEEPVAAISTLLPPNIGRSEDGGKEIVEIFDGKLFSYPKPPKLIKYLLEIATDQNDLILDFFAGSGTTGQAVMELNAEDGGNRKFILVQIGEPADETTEAFKAGYHTISAITKARIRKVIERMQAAAEAGGQPGIFEGEPLAAKPEMPGFRVYRWQPSNFREWQEPTNLSAAQIQISFDQAAGSRLAAGFAIQDIITEVMLQKGFPLHLPVGRQAAFTENEVWETVRDDGSGLLICLDEIVSPATANLLTSFRDHLFICRDEAVTDQVKLIFGNAGSIETI